MKARVSSCTSSVWLPSKATRASSCPWPKSLAVLAMVRRGMLCLRTNTVATTTATSTTKMATNRKISEIFFSTAVEWEMGEEAMTMPSAWPVALFRTGKDTT